MKLTRPAYATSFARGYGRSRKATARQEFGGGKIGFPPKADRLQASMSVNRQRQVIPSFPNLPFLLLF